MHSPQPLSTSAMTSQSHSTSWRHNSNTKNVAASAREYDRNRFEIYGSALEHVSISLCTRANTWMLDSVYIKGNQMIFWVKCGVFHCRVNYKITIYSVNWKRGGGGGGGGNHKRRLSRVHYICTMHCVQCTLKKQCTAHHVIICILNIIISAVDATKWLNDDTHAKRIAQFIHLDGVISYLKH